MFRSSSWASAFVAAGLLAALGSLASAQAAPPPDGAVEGVAITTSLSPAAVPPNAPVTVSASAPALVGQDVALEEYDDTGWAQVAHTLVPGSGVVEFHLRRWHPGVYYFRVHWLASSGGADPNGELSGATKQLVVTARGFGDPRAYSVSWYDGHPARWNPCQTITYRVNKAGAPGSAAGDLSEAIRRVAQATGLRLRYLGTTNEVYGARGFRWDADIDIAWASPGQTRVLNGSSEAGAGGAADGTIRRRQAVYTHGFVVLNRATMSSLPAGFGAGTTQGLVLLHELGHVVGLRHVNATDQIMQPTAQTDLRAALYGAGDLSGLALLGAGSGCI